MAQDSRKVASLALPFRAWLDVSERSATLGVDAGYRGVLSSNPTHTDSMMDGVSAIIESLIPKCSGAGVTRRRARRGRGRCAC